MVADTPRQCSEMRLRLLRFTSCKHVRLPSPGPLFPRARSGLRTPSPMVLARTLILPIPPAASLAPCYATGGAKPAVASGGSLLTAGEPPVSPRRRDAQRQTPSRQAVPPPPAAAPPAAAVAVGRGGRGGRGATAAALALSLASDAAAVAAAKPPAKPPAAPPRGLHSPTRRQQAQLLHEQEQLQLLAQAKGSTGRGKAGLGKREAAPSSGGRNNLALRVVKPRR